MTSKNSVSFLSKSFPCAKNRNAHSYKNAMLSRIGSNPSSYVPNHDLTLLIFGPT